MKVSRGAIRQTAEPDDTFRLVGLAYADALTDGDILRQAERRGLAVGILGSRSVQAAQSWLGDQYEVNAAALRDLGFSNGQLEDAPAFDDVLQAFGTPALIKLDQRRGRGFQDSLVINPSMRKVGLKGSKKNPGFIPRFDRKQGGATKTLVLESFWRNFTDKDKRHEPLATGDWAIAMVLDGGADTDGAPGTVYPRLNAKEQRNLLKTDQEDSDFGSSLALGSISLAQYITANTQNRLLGQPLLDSGDSFTRLVHYPDTIVRGFSLRSQVAGVSTDNGALQLGTSHAEEGYAAGGIREVLQVVEQPSPAAA